MLTGLLISNYKQKKGSLRICKTHVYIRSFKTCTIDGFLSILSNIKLPDVLWYINTHDFKLLMNNSIDNDKSLFMSKRLK